MHGKNKRLRFGRTSRNGGTIFVVGLAAVVCLWNVRPGMAVESYVEPGTLRLSTTLSLEGVLQRLRPGWIADESGINKTYTIQGNNDRPWKAQWGQSVLTELAARTTPDVFGRVLFEAQGEYADRFWRPLNINHHIDRENETLIFREAEGRIDKEWGYFHAFSGVSRGDWYAKGDFFRLYPTAIPERDYLGSSSYFGVYPKNWRQDQYLNITHRSIPRGAEAEARLFGTDLTVAYGDELSWGFRESVYVRWSVPTFAGSKLTFVYKDEDAPFSIFNEDDRNRAYELAWRRGFEYGGQMDVGVLYNPFRVGEQYKFVRDVPNRSGLLGTPFFIGERTSTKEDAFAGRVRIERHNVFVERLWIWVVDLWHAEILAGNKQQADVSLETSVVETVRAHVQYTYRRPIERAIPFIFEGTVDNIGAVAANPRGPESPFTVDWSNREAVFIVTTLQFDPTPGTNMFIYDPNALALWNLSPEEDSGGSFAVQYRMSDYRDQTDRQYYYDENGGVVYEDAAHTGAWPTDHPLHEVRFLGRKVLGPVSLVLGVAGGQAPALLGLAYSNDPSVEKPITEYFSIETRLERWPFAVWGHYGSGVWGPEENIHPAFGFSFDRLYGGGVSYNITTNTTWDINYLAARQDDNLFVAPDLGSFDEIRTVFSHRFGFLFQFQGPSRRGFQSR